MTGKNRDAKSRGLLLPLFLALVLSLAPTFGQAAEFVLLFSNDNHGEIDPCG